MVIIPLKKFLNLHHDLDLNQDLISFIASHCLPPTSIIIH